MDRVALRFIRLLRKVRGCADGRGRCISGVDADRCAGGGNRNGDAMCRSDRCRIAIVLGGCGIMRCSGTCFERDRIDRFGAFAGICNRFAAGDVVIVQVIVGAWARCVSLCRRIAGPEHWGSRNWGTFCEDSACGRSVSDAFAADRRIGGARSAEIASRRSCPIGAIYAPDRASSRLRRPSRHDPECRRSRQTRPTSRCSHGAWSHRKRYDARGSGTGTMAP